MRRFKSHTIATNISSNSAVPVGWSINHVLKWDGGRGYLIVGGFGADPQMHTTCVLAAAITWFRGDLPVEDNGVSLAPVLVQNPLAHGVLYPFDAPAGELRAGISVVSAGNMFLDQIHILR